MSFSLYSRLDNESQSEHSSLLPTTTNSASRTSRQENDTRTPAHTTSLYMIILSICLRFLHTLFSLLILRPLLALRRFLTRSPKDPDSGGILPCTTPHSPTHHHHPLFFPSSQSIPSPPSSSSQLTPAPAPTPNVQQSRFSDTIISCTGPTSLRPPPSASASSSLSSSPSSLASSSSSPPFSIHSLRSALKKQKPIDTTRSLVLTPLELDAESSSSSSTSDVTPPTPTPTTTSTTTTSSGLSTPIPIDIPGVVANTTTRKSVRFTDEDDLRVFEVESWEERERRFSSSGNGGGLGKWKKVGKTIVWQDDPERYPASLRNTEEGEEGEDKDEWWSKSFLSSWFLPTPPPLPPSSLSYPSDFVNTNSPLSSSYSPSSPHGRWSSSSLLSSSFMMPYGDETRFRDGLF